MPDYSKGKIYKITSPNCEQVYVGSTCCTLTKRFSVHKYDCRKNKGCTSEIILNAGDALIEIIELFPCTTKQELLKREGQIQQTTPNCCNKRIAGQTRQEYYTLNSNVLNQKSAVYRAQNADVIKQYQKEYRIKNKEHVLVV